MLAGRRDARNGQTTDGESQWSDMTVRLEALIGDYENGKARNESSASFFDQAVRCTLSLTGVTVLLQTVTIVFTQTASHPPFCDVGNPSSRMGKAPGARIADA
jgi:hypothetical protein